VRQALEQSEEKEGEGNAVLPVSRGNSSTTLDDDAAFIASIPELSLFEDTPEVDEGGSVKNETHPPALADKEFCLLVLWMILEASATPHTPPLSYPRNLRSMPRSTRHTLPTQKERVASPLTMCRRWDQQASRRNDAVGGI
ncbi:hypothetical protein TcCL_Unassigned07483, partial [Trypanosoma cruzi]